MAVDREVVVRAARVAARVAADSVAVADRVVLLEVAEAAEHRAHSTEPIELSFPQV